MALRSKKEAQLKILRQIQFTAIMGHFSPIRLAEIRVNYSTMLTRLRGTKHIDTSVCINQQVDNFCGRYFVSVTEITNALSL